MDIMGKLSVLADAAKYDSACTSSGVDRSGSKGRLGSAVAAGICHSFTPDGRCVSLLKVLQTNICIFDCLYCANRQSNDIARALFTPEEIADITIQFYRRNYIEGLFLSSAVIKSPDYTMELMIKSLSLLRGHYGFNGYIHAKCIPHADPLLIERLGRLADRISVNIELPSENSLTALAPAKTKTSILKPMGYIASRIKEADSRALALRGAPRFAPAGHSTQMIIGATPDTDLQIIRLSEGLYRRYGLKRVFYSAFLPQGAHHSLVPNGQVSVPLLREHRLYQADWLVRFYGFEASEILDEAHPNFNVYFDPKCDWALRHLERFPVEIMRADKELLLRVPGMGVRSVERVVASRGRAALTFEALKRMGVVMKRAQYFITCQGKMLGRFPMNREFIIQNLLAEHMRKPEIRPQAGQQLSFIGDGGGPPLWGGMGRYPGGADSAITAMLPLPPPLPGRETAIQSIAGEL